MHSDIKNLIDKNKYQVLLLSCPANFPFSFAIHPWFVINKKGMLSRWEVLFRTIDHETRWGHLYKDFLPPFEGIEIFPFSQKYSWKEKLIGKIEGEEARQIAEYIESSPTTYPYRNKYFLTGPNSNTYVQWILGHFPEVKIDLSWNSFGKNFNS